ncbi:MAG: hypothetical protein ACOC4M_12070 [Promethearchaeia archaeon]
MFIFRSYSKTLREVNNKDYPQKVITFLMQQFSPSYIRKLNEISLFLVVEIDTKTLGTTWLQDKKVSTVFVLPKYQNQG